MRACDACGRLVLPGTSICPFCATVSATSIAGAVVMPFVLSACYGPPPCNDVDDDGDGYDECSRGWGNDSGGDCDDADPAISPAATDTCGDTIDQNCDGIVSSTTQAEVCTVAGDIDVPTPQDDDCDGLADDVDPDCQPADTDADTDRDSDADTDTSPPQ